MKSFKYIFRILYFYFRVSLNAYRPCVVPSVKTRANWYCIQTAKLPGAKILK